jgi:Mn2+/Fe2+ NRAMP family transporter
MVAVGYMDPGNRVTGLAGGPTFGQALLFIALMSNIKAIVLPSLCARLAIASGRDLAQACRDACPRRVRRLITRSIAIIPAAGVTILSGESETARLLILTQVALSLQLSFAVVPLVMFTTDRRKMGALTAPPWLAILKVVIAAIIVVLNLKLLYDFL